VISSLLTRVALPTFDRGDPKALVKRGIAYQEKGQPLEALRVWKLAGEKGSAEACYRIGVLYARGEGVLRSAPDAVAWYNSAAEAGHLDAQFQLGLTYLYGAAAHPSVAEWLRSTKENVGERAEHAANAMFPFGVTVPKDAERAHHWILRAAQSGKAEAQLVVADMYRQGRGCEKDLAEARHWYEQAAGQGVAGAEFGLGDVHFQGLGVPVDLERAADHYSKAAEQGDTRSQVALASIYLTGQGRPADLKQAPSCSSRPQSRASRVHCSISRCSISAAKA
jgi:TPR repeat protein